MKHSQIVLLSTLMLLMQCGSMFAMQKKVACTLIETDAESATLEQLPGTIKGYETEIEIATKKYETYNKDLMRDRGLVIIHQRIINQNSTTKWFCCLTGFCFLGLGAIGAYKAIHQQNNERSTPAKMVTGGLILGGLGLLIKSFSPNKDIAEREKAVRELQKKITEIELEPLKLSRSIGKLHQQLKIARKQLQQANPAQTNGMDGID